MVEVIHGEQFALRDDIRRIVVEYLEIDYNRDRRNSAIGYIRQLRSESVVGGQDQGFDLLGYRFQPQRRLQPAGQPLNPLIERARRLHWQRASYRLRWYVRRWYQ